MMLGHSLSNFPMMFLLAQQVTSGLDVLHTEAHTQIRLEAAMV